ncbi:MAG: primosomal protein N' [Chitinophagaceae bacterium]|nr:primosomal protein N' [Chitinophagaceae bacterium]MCB9044924.1 primosomal protein N' [Chitinophagales bacterium]
MSLLQQDSKKNHHSFADIILPLSLPRLLTYGVPIELQADIKEGMRVEVALGRNKLYSGIVAGLHAEKPDAYEVKPVRALLDEEPVVNQLQLQFWQWIADYYMAAPGEVMQAALPAHLKLTGETRLQWMPQHNDVVYEWSNKAYPAAEALETRNELTISEFRAITGVRNFSVVLNELLENEVVVIHDELETAYRPKKEKVIRLHHDYKGEEKMHQLFDELQNAPKQLSLLMAYIELSVKYGTVPQKNLLERADATAAQVKALTDKKIFVIEEVTVDRLTVKHNNKPATIDFTPAQEKAYNELELALAEKDVVLMEGVTGSGKTMLYIKKLKECIEQGKQAILLLPEIALTTQLVSRLYAYFGDELGVYHSRFTNNERVEIWEKTRLGKYKIIAGPRSALWLPYGNLGLVIVDEEHDASYKQKDPAPRFNARDAAIYMAALHGTKTILGSATPSVESIYNSRNEKYGYVRLAERYLGIEMPNIEIVNAKSLESVRKQGVRMITPELTQAIKAALSKHKQVVLFQNRRGYAPFQVCVMCGWVPHCKNCAVSLTYHKSTDKLHCHYCGLKSAVVHVCPSCGSNSLQAKTFGTEKIEEEIGQIFPEAKTARMDVDSMRGKTSFSELFEKLEQRKIDILIGTQMVVKGLDFAPIELVGILSADSLLNFPDFRVNERAFQLMEQVSGRAGRTDGKGKVMIQAYNLTHPVLQWVKAHDVRSFYEHEIKYREQFAYPPFTRFIKITFRHRDEPRTVAAAGQMAQALQQVPEVGVQGPVQALIPRVRNLYVQEVWVKCPRNMSVIENTKAFIKATKEYITSAKGNSSLQVQFDVDPM